MKINVNGSQSHQKPQPSPSPALTNPFVCKSWQILDTLQRNKDTYKVVPPSYKFLYKAF